MYALIGSSVSPVMTPFQVLVDIPGSGALTKNCCFDLISCVCWRTWVCWCDTSTHLTVPPVAARVTLCDKRPPWSFGEASRPFTWYVCCSVRCKKKKLFAVLLPWFLFSFNVRTFSWKVWFSQSTDAGKWSAKFSKCNQMDRRLISARMQTFQPWCGLPHTGVCPAYHVRSSSMLLAWNGNRSVRVWIW